MWSIRWCGENTELQSENAMRRVNILGVEISAVNKETAIQYLLKNMDKARGRYICACNVHTTVTAHENLDYQAVQNNSFMTLPDGKPLSSVGIRRGYSEMGRVTGPDFMEQVIAATEKSDARHYFYGTTQENLNALLEYLKVNYTEKYRTTKPPYSQLQTP